MKYRTNRKYLLFLYKYGQQSNNYKGVKMYKLSEKVINNQFIIIKKVYLQYKKHIYNLCILYSHLKYYD